ncbi:MFS transporter [Streptosporangium soli]|nr:hypothetical protein [Streptosporangium sp. KLBMP 9127]
MDGGLAILVIGSLAMAAGVGAVVALATDLVVASAPAERAGSASALSETGTEFGGALGMAVLGSVGVAVYRAELTDTMPAGLAPDTADAARDTLGGAAAAAADLPQETGARLIEAANAAYVSGVHVTAMIGAAVLLVAAILAARLLRHVPRIIPERVTRLNQGPLPNVAPAPR